MFPAPSAKKKVSTAPGNPLPIPLKGYGGVPPSPWPLYEAQFRLGEIVVTDQSHAKALHYNGFFGHGALSNKGLDYEVLSKKITAPQYSRKLCWRSLQVSSPGMTPNKRKRDDSHDPCYIPRKYIYVIPSKTKPNDGTNADNPPEDDDVTLSVDPFPVDEVLVLIPEEAVFLAFALGCLVVSDEGGNSLSIDALWQRLVQESPELVYRYSAYHQLRADGWVVRPAPRYSAHYMLYAVGPLYYHSQYLVKVEGHDAALLTPITAQHISTAHHLNVLDRIASNVQKMFMLCVVLRPPSLTNTDCVRRCVNKLRVEQLPFTWKNIDTSEPSADNMEE